MIPLKKFAKNIKCGEVVRPNEKNKTQQYDHGQKLMENVSKVTWRLGYGRLCKNYDESCSVGCIREGIIRCPEK